ncbi:hypothetical protein [Streptomyces sp. NPDC086023]|uniref:hypothetical protein n=1 Tax=Streptomyces sp. NPDC086023 TaxID=3365746 RepID=UPI0037D7A9DE
MTTLGELFDAAVAHLRRVPEVPLASMDPAERVACISEVDSLLEQVHKGLGPRAYTPVPTSDERPLTWPEQSMEYLLGQARASLGTARSHLRTPAADDAGPAGDLVRDAAVAIAAVRDTIGSHLGPDRAPLTPYAYLLRHQFAFDYLSRRYSEVAWSTARVCHALAGGVDHPVAYGALAQARQALERASVFTRVTTRDADMHLEAFPLALPLVPVQATAEDATSAVPARLAEDSERLSRAAYGALHDRDEQRLSGADIKQLSHWMSIARILTGRTLLHVASDLPDGPVADGMKATAQALRSSAMAWKTAAGEWRNVVDTADPREHPKLPLPGYDLVRRGMVVRMPMPDPHPAVVISRTAATRLGQLLFGAQWTPEAKPGPPRPAAEILADAGGSGPLTAALYRLPAAGWQLAAAAPWSIRRAQAGLVSQVPEHRPPGLDPAQRFHPVQPREVEALTNAYAAVMTAEQAAAGALLDTARRAGTRVPRAVLDAAAHRAIAEEQKWAADRQTEPRPRNLPRAYVPQELVVGRRPGMRR